MEKTKIIHISTNVHPGVNKKNLLDKVSNDWYAWEATRMKKLYPSLHIECWTFEGGQKKEIQITHKDIKFRIFPANLNIRHSMGFSIPMLKALKEEEINTAKKNTKLILHLHEYHCWQSLLILLFKNNLTKVIAQHHGARDPFKNLKKYPRLGIALPYILFMQIAEKNLLKKASEIYFLSDEEEKYLDKVAPKVKKVFRTMGIDDNYFKHISKEDARNKLGLSKDRKYILYLGRIKTTKGIKELLDAFKRLTNKPLVLLIVGEGVDFEKYREYVEQKGIKNVTFTGPKYGSEKELYLSASDCLILPSHTEGAPVVIMEALAKNLPIIATDVGGIPRMINNGKEGIIIPPGSNDAILKALNKILKWPSKNLENYASKYKWTHIIKQTVKDYNSL